MYSLFGNGCPREEAGCKHPKLMLDPCVNMPEQGGQREALTHESSIHATCDELTAPFRMITEGFNDAIYKWREPEIKEQPVNVKIPGFGSSIIGWERISDLTEVETGGIIQGGVKHFAVRKVDPFDPDMTMSDKMVYYDVPQYMICHGEEIALVIPLTYVVYYFNSKDQTFVLMGTNQTWKTYSVKELKTLRDIAVADAFTVLKAIHPKSSDIFSTHVDKFGRPILKKGQKKDDQVLLYHSETKGGGHAFAQQQFFSDKPLIVDGVVKVKKHDTITGAPPPTFPSRAEAAEQLEEGEVPSGEGSQTPPSLEGEFNGKKIGASYGEEEEDSHEKIMKKRLKFDKVFENMIPNNAVWFGAKFSDGTEYEYSLPEKLVDQIHYTPPDPSTLKWFPSRIDPEIIRRISIDQHPIHIDKKINEDKKYLSMIGSAMDDDEEENDNFGYDRKDILKGTKRFVSEYSYRGDTHDKTSLFGSDYNNYDDAFYGKK